jgi:hypothetical protein
MGLAVLTTVFGSAGGGADEAQGISTALTFAAVFPLTALILFACWARRTRPVTASG